MTYNIYCPVQDSGSFDITQCFHCPKFEQNIGKATSYSCRANTRKPQRTHFEGAVLSFIMRIPDSVSVIGDKEPK